MHFSRAAWTSVPRTVATVGGSGRPSMAEKRNRRAHSVNDDTFDGDSDEGSSSGMVPG